MVTMELPADLSQFVESEVAAGRYSSPDEVVHTALRLLKEQLEKWRRLKVDIDAAYEQIARGEYIEINSLEEHEALMRSILEEARIESGATEITP